MKTIQSILVSVLSAVVLLMLFTSQVQAQMKISYASARFIPAVASETVTDNRVAKLKAYLKQYDSPMAESAATFIEEADKYNLDWKFVAAVAGVESWYGHRIPLNSNNAWGWGVYGDNVIRFTSWDEGIRTISHDIRMKYMTKWGATNIYEIGRIYAADPNWAYKVQRFMSDIETFTPVEQPSLSISI